MSPIMRTKRKNNFSIVRNDHGHPNECFFHFMNWSFFSCCPFENSYSHRCHIALHSFFPSWTERTCCFIWSFREELQSQILHLNDLFFSWTDSKSFFMASFREQLSRTFALILYTIFLWLYLASKKKQNLDDSNLANRYKFD